MSEKITVVKNPHARDVREDKMIMKYNEGAFQHESDFGIMDTWHYAPLNALGKSAEIVKVYRETIPYYVVMFENESKPVVFKTLFDAQICCVMRLAEMHHKMLYGSEIIWDWK